MKKTAVLMLQLILLFYGCNSHEDSISKWKKEITDTEAAFAALVQQEGIKKGFLAYAAEDAVVKRGKNVIVGKEALEESYEKQEAVLESINLTWKPDFVDVSSSGDLGYTYGKYTFKQTDSLGNISEDTGIFHTVWKRQKDGQWRFVWD